MQGCVVYYALERARYQKDLVRIQVLLFKTYSGFTGCEILVKTLDHFDSIVLTYVKC